MLDTNRFETNMVQTLPMTAVNATGVSVSLTPPQKAAIILVTMGPEFAGPIAEKMSDTHLRIFFRTLEGLKDVPREDLLAVIADFVTTLDRRKAGFQGGPKRAREIAEGLLNSERVSLLLGNDVPETKVPDDAAGIWFEMSKRDALDIARFLNTQKVEVGTVILTKISTEKAGEVLSELPEQSSIKFISRLSQKQVIAPHAYKAVTELVRTDFLTAKGQEGGGSDSALDFVASLMSSLSKYKRDIVMDGLEKSDPERAQKIRSNMLTFEDLPTRLPPTAIQVIFKNLDKPDLLAALKAAGGEMKDSVEYLFANISQRMADQMKEEIEEMDDLPQKDGDKAIVTMMNVISRLEKDGKITLLKKPEAA